MTVLLGKGDGTFKPGIAYTAGDGPNGLAAADLDEDGRMDLAIASNDNHQLSILYGNADGTFAAPVYYPVGTHPRYQDGTLRPSVAVNRAEAAATVVRTMGWTTSDGKTDFADDASIAAWAKPYAAAASQHGLMKGASGNRFEPALPMTRAEAAAILVRLSKLPD